MKKIQSKLYELSFYISLYTSFLILFTTYEIIDSPDFLNKYINYLNFYSGNLKITNVEQGHFYFFYQYLMSLTILNFSSALNLYEVLNLSFHVGNTILYLVGLIGIKKYLIQNGFNKNNIYLAMSVSNFMAASLFLRLTYKPEILVITFLPWVIINFDKFLKERKLSSLVKVSILTSLLLTSKASISVMVGLLLVLIYKKYLYKNLIYLVPIILLTLVLILESYILNGRSIIEVEHSENYNNQASVEFFTSFDSKNFINNPNKYFHNKSFIGITLFDTFNDFFGLYWNSQYTELNIDRKNFFTIKKNIDETRPLNISFDKETKVFTFIGDFDSRWDDPNYIDETRLRFCFIMSVIFYFLLIIIAFFKKNLRILVLSPFLGLIFVGLSASGLFGNNFDPLVGDSVKTFYYSFFTAISFNLVLVIIFEYFPLRKIFSAVLLLFFLFFIGFPHSYAQNIEEVIEYKNSQIISCEQNMKILTVIYGLEKEIKCVEIDSNFKRTESIADEYFDDIDLNFRNIPATTAGLTFILIITLLLEKLNFWIASIKLKKVELFK